MNYNIRGKGNVCISFSVKNEDDVILYLGSVLATSMLPDVWRN